MQRFVPLKQALTISPSSAFVTVHRRKPLMCKSSARIPFRLKNPSSKNACWRQIWRPRSRSRSALSRCSRAASRHSPDNNGNSAETRTTTDNKDFFILRPFCSSTRPPGHTITGSTGLMWVRNGRDALVASVHTEGTAPRAQHAPMFSVCSVTAVGRSVCSVVETGGAPPLQPRRSAALPCTHRLCPAQ